MMIKQFCVYIMASKKDGVLYIGVTSYLIKRNWQHKEGIIEGFTKRYWAKRLVYYELHDSGESAIIREKQMKKWNREWKIRLIESQNPDWLDLTNEILGIE
jgi:putative endonuclease